MLKKYRYLDTDIYIYEQDKNQQPVLLQHEKANPLSLLRDDKGNKPYVVINASYVDIPYVSGRDQGDLRNKCYTNSENGMYCDLIFLPDGTHKVGKFNNWDYRGADIKAAMSPATILIKDGEDCELISTLIENVTKITKKNPQTAIAVLDNNQVLYIVSDGRSTENKGISGVELRKFIRDTYPNVRTLCQLDGGGSSEMLVDGEIVNKPSDGKERNLLNGFAFVEPPENVKPYEPLMCPFKRMKVTQYDGEEFSHKGSDAWDITSGTAGVKDAYFAPVNMTCKAISKPYAFTWWETDEKVEFADGTVDYATIMFGHDDSINAKIGMKITKGTQVGNMGTGGNASGVHCHIEVAKGKYKGTWYPNNYGVYCLYNSIKFYDAFFMDDVKLIDIPSEIMLLFKYKNAVSLDSLTARIAELESENKILESENKEMHNKLNQIKEHISSISELLGVCHQNSL